MTRPAMRLSIFSVQDHYPASARTLPQLYGQVIAQAELADRLGYDTFFVAEHHFHEYGAVPNPSVMLSTLAQRTKRLRLGSAISILTFHHPLTVAESYAMVDVLSGGRLVLGVGSGYLKHEFEGYHIDPAEKRDRFDENLAILKRALAGERVTFKGRFNTLDAVQINVLPVQRQVPIYVAILAKTGAYHVGRQGNAILCVPYASVDRFEEIGPMIAEFRKGRAEAGLPPSDDDGAYCFHTHVAESDEACGREAAEAFDLYVATRLYAKKQVYDDIQRSGLGLFGSVETVADKMVRLHDMGVRQVLALQNFGLMAPELVHNSMRLMQLAKLPRVAERPQLPGGPMRSIKLLSASLLAIGAVLLARPATAQSIELKLSHFLPPVHGMHTDFMEPWARELEKRTNNKVKVTIFPGGSSFGDVARQWDQMNAGVIDIAHGLHGIPRGRFPRTSIIDLPFLTESADAATRTLWALLPKYLAEEYRGVRVLALHAHNGGLIHTREKTVAQLSDLKGLRIRAPSPAVQMMLEYLGATPVGLPPGQVYENLQKGAIDGAVFPWDPVASFKLAEVLKHHLDARTYTVSFFFVMNQRKYDALPSDVRQAIDSISGDALIPKFGPWWAKWDQAGLEQAKARGNTILRLSDSERQKWRQALAPMTEAYLGAIEKQGVKNVREIYDEAQRLVAQFEKKP